MKNIKWMCWIFIAWLLSPALTTACILCSSQGVPLSQEIRDAKFVVFGHIADSRLGPDGIRGTSELQIESVLQGSPAHRQLRKITLPRYVPIIPGVKYLIFLDIAQDQFDPYRNIVCPSDRLLDYLKKMPVYTGTGNPDQRQARLKYTFDYLQDAEPELAADAYKEWSVATNQDVAAVATQVSADKLRCWLLDPKTPNHCLSLYAFLLGASGQAADGALLSKLAHTPPDARYAASLDGILSGLVKQQADDAWNTVKIILADEKRSFSERHAVMRFLRFQWEIDQEKSKKHIIASLDQLIDQPDTMDLAINQLRQWKCWEHQTKIFKLYSSSPPLAPITRRAIIRYALTCPGDAALTFLNGAKAQDEALVREVQESLELAEKPD